MLKLRNPEIPHLPQENITSFFTSYYNDTESYSGSYMDMAAS